MKVAIIIEVFDEYVDLDHETGLTGEGYSMVMDAAMSLPGDFHDIRPIEAV